MDKRIVYMIKIVLDESKIKSEEKYNPQKLYELVDKYFSDYGMDIIKSDNLSGRKILFYGCDEEHFGDFAFVIMTLYHEEWFEPYLLQYKYYSKYNPTTKKWKTEDVLKTLQRRYKGS